MDCVKLGFFGFCFFFWLPMVAASDNLLSPKGVNYEGMCQVGSSSKDTKPMSFCFVVFFFYFILFYFFLLNVSLINSVFFWMKQ